MFSANLLVFGDTISIHKARFKVEECCQWLCHTVPLAPSSHACVWVCVLAQGSTGVGRWRGNMRHLDAVGQHSGSRGPGSSMGVVLPSLWRAVGRGSGGTEACGSAVISLGYFPGDQLNNSNVVNCHDRSGVCVYRSQATTCPASWLLLWNGETSNTSPF